MKIPKVKFELAKNKFETEMLYYFCFTNNHSSYVVFKKYPALKKNLSKAKTKNKRLKVINSFVKAFWKKNKKDLEKNSKKFQKEWNKINDKYMFVLSEILETKWPTKRKKIRALVSLNPIYPRFLKDWTFSVYGFKKNKKELNEIISHEVLHFLYFKKWKEIFPKSKERTFDIPYLEWNLSEILAPIILGNPKIQKIIKQKPVGYPEHKKIKINKKSVTNHFNSIYKKSLIKKEPFEVFLKKSYREAKKYKDLIKWKST